MPENNIVIVDYGLGNLFSLQRAIHFLGYESAISGEPQFIEEADRIFLPGVGAFGDGMDQLKRRGLVEPLLKAAQNGKPMLGICLGMQLFMSSSEEFGFHAGLNLVPGHVVRFSHPPEFKVPNAGWRALERPEIKFWNQTILHEVQEQEFMYFVHSYYVVPKDKGCALAMTEYGGIKFCSVLRIGNLYGTQFHPEKSGRAGLTVLRNFLTLALPQKKELQSAQSND